MPSMRDIKRRRESVQSTGQITRAMKLVATVKLQKGKGRAIAMHPYFAGMQQIVSEILSQSGGQDNVYLKGNGQKKRAYLLITSNRGLAGGYNSNIVKEFIATAPDQENCLVYPVGRKGKETMQRLGYPLADDYSEVINDPLFSDAVAIGGKLLRSYLDHEVGEIYLAYTEFVNTVTHVPHVIRLLPYAGEGEQVETASLMEFEPEPEEALAQIIPLYLNSMIYGALVEAFASENGARMQAMDNATSNAEEMCADLALQYNRARQGSITQEITEIVAGASAIE